MIKIGILGGSFDPPHKGHIYISHESKKRLNLKQIWWIPTLQNPLKNNMPANYDNRVTLCKEKTKEYPHIKIKNIKYFYATNLIRSLKLKFNNVDFYWIMGADNISNLHNWYRYQEFIKNVRIAVFARDNYLIHIRKARCWKFLNQKHPLIISCSKMNISSSKIRELNE